MVRKKDEGLLGLPVDARTAVDIGQMGAGMLGKMNAPITGALTIAGTSMDIDAYTREAASIMGGDSTSKLTIDSQAFKDHVKSLSGLYEERLLNVGVGMAGSSAALGLAAITLGPPGWIGGLLLAAGGGIAASMGKEFFFPSQNRMFAKFAADLQTMGQEGRMTAEAAYVALVMNMPDPYAIRNVINSFPREAGIRNVNDMVKALGSEEGVMYLRQSMVENDMLVRASAGVLAAAPDVTLSGQLAEIINNGQMAGVDLLSSERTMQTGMLINMARTQQAQLAMMKTASALQNPNQHLPKGKHTQLSV